MSLPKGIPFYSRKYKRFFNTYESFEKFLINETTRRLKKNAIKRKYPK